jgi:serine/threonine-protein kinase
VDLDALLASLSPLLDHAADLEPDARAAWLAELRRSRPDLARELETLLSDESVRLADGILAPQLVTALSEAAPAGGQVGPYALIRPLGHGGMGTVWLGRRNDGRYAGDVAVKLLSGALLHPAGAERFRREAGALARLAHPSIARLLDAGTSAVGQPYLILEHVDGVAIDEYCDARRLPVGRRLELFRQVLGAVAHAHANLVVHRDIKPSNILVTADGTVKLLDFGIAKLLDPDSPDGATEGTGVYTPRFAAPEQLTGAPVTTATDIYALGVLLFLLLAGRHPTGDAGADRMAVVRSVLETEPARLSGAILPEAASLRSATPERLRRLYRGDLENIVARALDKVPSKRYPTVAALNADLDRFARHEPVEARAASLAQRTRKFIRRNRGAVAAGSAIVTILLAAVIVTASQAAAARRERDTARRQRDAARYQSARAAASSLFMQSLLADVGASGEAITTISLLDRARTLLEHDYQGDPRFIARMLTELADQYDAQFNVAQSRAVLARAESLAAAADDPETVANASCRLAMESNVALHMRPWVLTAWEALRRVPEPETLTRVRCRLAEGQLAAAEGRPVEALRLMESAVALSRAAGDTVSVSYFSAINAVGELVGSSGRKRDALEMQRSAIRVLRRIGRGNTVGMAAALESEMLDLFTLGEVREADSVRRLALAMRQRMAPPDRMTALHGTYAVVFASALGHRDTALILLDSIIAVARSAQAVGQLTWALEFSAGLLGDSGLVSLAEARVVEADRLRPPRDSGGALPHARLEAARGRPGAALGALVALLRPGRSRFSPLERHRLLVTAARTALAADSLRLADSLIRDLIGRLRAIQQEEARSGNLGSALLILSRVQQSRGDHAGAHATARRALPGLELGLGPDHPETRAARAWLDSLSRGPPATK